MLGRWKKRVLASILVIVLLLPIQVYAAPANGGLLKGRTDGVINASKGPITNPNNLTDGNDSTFATATVSSAGAEISYDLGSDKTIAAYYLHASSSSVVIRFESASHAMIGTMYGAAPATGSAWISITAVPAVRYVIVENQTISSQSMYEADIAETIPPDTTPPPIPTGFAGTVGNTQVDLSWNAVTAPDLKSYKVYKGTTLVNTIMQPTTTYTVTGLTNGLAYDFYVTSLDTVGNESAKSVKVTVTPTGPPDSTAPEAATNLTAVPGNKSANLAWTGSISTDVTGYNVYKTGVKVNLLKVTSPNYQVTGLTNGTTYTFEVTALDSAGNESGYSNSATVTPKDVMKVSVSPNGTSIIFTVNGGVAPYTATVNGIAKTFSSTMYYFEGLEKSTDYTIYLESADGQQYNGLLNTGSVISFTPPTMPSPTELFQDMVNMFGKAGTIAIIVIGGAVSLGIIVILGLWAWRLTKKWLNSSK
jgi:hypothetical protein